MKRCKNCGDEPAEDSNYCESCNKIRALLKAAGNKVRYWINAAKEAQGQLDMNRKNRLGRMPKCQEETQ